MDRVSQWEVFHTNMMMHRKQGRAKGSIMSKEMDNVSTTKKTKGIFEPYAPMNKDGSMKDSKW